MHRSTTRKVIILPRLTGAVLTASAMFVLAGCSGAGATTCDEYASLSHQEQSDLERGLLEAHDLEPNHVGNSVGVRQSILSYCGLAGTSMVTGQAESATQNVSSPIEEAVDWEASTW